MKRTVFVLLIVSALFSCQRQGSESASVPVIALVMKTLNNPFFIEMQEGAQAAATALQAKLLVQAPERELDVEKQMQIIENLIQRKVAAICVTPSGSKEIIPAIIKANQAGIPILVVDTRVDSAALAEAGAQIATFIGSDNFDGGRMAGRMIIEKLGGKGNIAILEGVPGHETGDSRLRGFHHEVDKAAGISIVASQTANFERDQGYSVFQNILESQQKLDAVFACNDMMALGAVEAIAAANRGGQIVVVGFDAITDAREAIKNGAMTASIAQNPRDMGKIAIENALHLIKGESIPEYIPVKIDLIQ